MATKKKKSTKTASKKAVNKTHKKVSTRTNCKKGSKKELSNSDRMHIYIVTALSFVAAILLCMDVAMVNLS